MNNYLELTQALNDMLAQDELYKPTAFWQEASSKIESELNEYGVEKFRSLKTALGFFVPTYGIPGNGFNAVQSQGLTELLINQNDKVNKPQLMLEQFLSGYISALSDYRVLQAADDSKRLPYLNAFSESKYGDPIEQFEFDGRHFSRSSLNYLLGLALLKKHLKGPAPKTVLEIGGGFGTLGEILNNSGVSDLRYIDIDIPPTSFVAQNYLSELVGEKNVATYSKTSNHNIIPINSLPVMSVLCSWQIKRLQGQIDLFVNFISFQEMEPHVVKNYLSHVMRLGASWILLRNMKEGKNIRREDGAGVITPILSEDYLAMLPGYKLVERNVLPFGYLTVDGFNSELLLLKLKE